MAIYKKKKHALYCFGENILIGITYPISNKLWKGPGYPEGISYLEPKLKYFRQTVKKLGEYESSDEIKKQNICAYINFKQTDKSDFIIKLKENYNHKKYLAINVAGKLIELEDISLACQFSGQKSTSLESIIGRTLHLASARDGYVSLHGGATIDEKNKEVYFVIGTEHGIGKTTLLFDFIKQGQKMVSNSLRLKINKNKHIFIYPQFHPSKNEYFYLKPPRTYAELKNKGFLPESLGIKEIIGRDANIPMAQNEHMLSVPAIRDKLDITNNYKILVLHPKAVDIGETKICPPLTENITSQIEDSWKATWNFLSIYEDLKINIDSKSKIAQTISNFKSYILKERKHILEPLIKKIGDLYFEVNYSKGVSAILPAVKSKMISKTTR